MSGWLGFGGDNIANALVRFWPPPMDGNYSAAIQHSTAQYRTEQNSLHSVSSWLLRCSISQSVSPSLSCLPPYASFLFMSKDFLLGGPRLHMMARSAAGC